MKHKKLSISIVSAFIAALGLTACSSVSADTDNIVTLIGSDKSEIKVNTNAIYNKFKNTEDGLSSFYQAILEVMIRDYFESDSAKEDVKKQLEGFEKSAHNDVKADKERARDNKETNNTDYDTEWKAILDAAGVKDEEGLYQKHLYDYEKEKYEDEYFETHKADLTDEYIGFKKGQEGYETFGTNTSMYPYHIRHILVKTTAAPTDYVTSEITSAEAQKLNTVYEALVGGRSTFGGVAKEWSEDGSASNFGDAGIMTTATSFVNEFKLGIYAYDCVYGTNVTGEAGLKGLDNVGKKLGLTGDYNESATTVKEKLEQIGLGSVSYEVFKFLGEEYNTESDDAGYQVNKGTAKSFPRNVIWNNYLNLHNVFVITDETVKENIGGHENTPVFDSYHFAKPEAAKEGQTGFREIESLGLTPGTKVLTDEDGRVIVGVRSEFGIHFMIMERTPFETAGTINGISGQTYKTDETTLAQYYTTYKPGEVKFPKNEAGTELTTYVNSIVSEDASVYTERAKTVKDEIKGFDKVYDYRIFEELLDKGNIKINDKEVDENLTTYIKNKRENNIWTITNDMNKAWNSYIDKIDRQDEERDNEVPGKSKRLIHATCAIKFKNPGSEFDKGGECYYEA